MPRVEEINRLEPGMRALSDAELQGQTEKFGRRFKSVLTVSPLSLMLIPIALNRLRLIAIKL